MSVPWKEDEGQLTFFTMCQDMIKLEINTFIIEWLSLKYLFCYFSITSICVVGRVGSLLPSRGSWVELRSSGLAASAILVFLTQKLTKIYSSDNVSNTYSSVSQKKNRKNKHPTNKDF